MVEETDIELWQRMFTTHVMGPVELTKALLPSMRAAGPGGMAGGQALDLEALDEALTRLAEFDPALARLVDVRFFGGLSIEESAAALGLSPATLKRRWAVARAWLARELGR